MSPRRLARPLLISVACRALVTLIFTSVGALAAVYGDDLAQGRPWPSPGASSRTLAALTMWDGAWYVSIAESGYGPATEPASLHAFFPGFPMVIRAAMTVTGLSAAAAGVAAVAAASVAAGVLVWLLAAHLVDDDFADRSAVLFHLGPGGFVLSMVYAEALLLAAAAGCLLALLHRRWVIAGLAGMIAVAVRPNGLALVLACAVSAWAAMREERDLRSLAAPVLTASGVVPYFVFLYRRTGHPFAWFEAQREAWDEYVAVTAPLERLVSAAQQVVGSGDRNWNDIVTTLGLVATIVGVVLLLRWRPPLPVIAFAVGVVALTIFSSNIGMRPRFVTTAFPILFAFAWRLRGLRYVALVAGSTVAMTMLTVALVTTTLVTP